MKIIITVTDAGNEKVLFDFKIKGKTDRLPVLRAISRMARAINEEYAHVHLESEFVEHMLSNKKEKNK